MVDQWQKSTRTSIRASMRVSIALLLWITSMWAVADGQEGEQLSEKERARREEANRLFSVANAYREQGDHVHAAEILEEVADLAYDNPDAQYHAGMAHLQAGRLDDAKFRWEKCLELQQDHSVAMFNLATLFAETGNVVKATEMMQKVLQIQPEDPDNYKTLAILLFKQDKNQEAIAEYMKCIHREPLHADCYCGMGNAFVRIGKYDEAQEAYTAAANINPNEAGYSNNIGNLLVRHHRFNHTAQQLAIKYLKNSVSLDGTYADGYFNLGEAYSAVSQYDFAVNAIKFAMKLDPNRQDYKCTLHLDMRKL